VGGCEHDRVGIGCGELRNDQAVTVDAHGNRLESGALDRESLPAPAGILDRDSARAALTQRVPNRGEAVGDTAADDDALGLDHDSARSPEICGEGITELRRSAVNRVGQPGIGQVTQRLSQRSLPAAAREQMEIGQAWPQVVAEPRRGAELTWRG
jgi:hypothetical protein